MAITAAQVQNALELENNNWNEKMTELATKFATIEEAWVEINNKFKTIDEAYGATESRFVQSETAVSDWKNVRGEYDKPHSRQVQ